MRGLGRWRRPLRRSRERSFASSQIRIVPRLDYAFLRENADMMRDNIRHRKCLPRGDDRKDPVGNVLEKYAFAMGLRTELEELQRERNRLTKESKAMMKRKEKNEGDLRRVRDRGRELKESVGRLAERLNVAEEDLNDASKQIPNRTHPDAPIGDESNARVVRTFGPPIDPTRTEANSHHVDLCRVLDLADFEGGAAVAGSKFVFLKNDAARMELALASFAMDRAIDAGFTAVSCPDIVKTSLIDGCGFAPRDDEPSQTYAVSKRRGDSSGSSSRAARDEDGEEEEEEHASSSSSLALVGTAEIPLAGLLANRVLSDAELPVKFVGISHCFRTEAGARGRESKGLYRLHQFTKVELFAFARPDESDAVLEDICAFQERLYEDLELSCRVLDMPTEELGASAYRKYDVEAWMPSRGGYGEICSASNRTDFQSRRLNVRYDVVGAKEDEGGERRRPRGRKQRDFVHTLNGTAVAVPRVLLALMETHGDRIPESLRPYMNGRARMGEGRGGV